MMMRIKKTLSAFALMGLLLVTGVSGAAAQTPITDAQAQSYQQNCIAQPNPNITPQTQQIFCACTAEQLKKTLTVEDMAATRGNDQAARDAMNKTIVNVYAPCMEFPVRDMVFMKCQKDAYQAGQQICQCLSSNMAKYVSQRAKSDLPAILAANPNVTDPMQAIVESPDYQQMEKRIALGCIQGEFK